MSRQKPSSITGGCLCGGVRYQIDFSPDHDWERGPHTCQCTQCRKNCGSLVYNFHTVKASELTYISKSTYAEYSSSSGCYRAFCKSCGSPLSWCNRTLSTDIEIAVGSVDEEFLLGNRNADDTPVGAYGVALADPAGDHFHLRNEIAGVTDGIAVSGKKFWKCTADGPLADRSRT